VLVIMPPNRGLRAVPERIYPVMKKANGIKRTE
jgi:hypothetical protein